MSSKASMLSHSISMTSLNADAVPRCSTHRKGLKFFCSKHELLLCSVCAVKRHRGCEEILTITEASEDKKSEGKKLCDVYNQRIALLENAIVERKAAKKLLDTNAQEIQNEVHEVTQRLIDLVKHEERTIIQSLHDMQTKESETLERDITGLENMCSKVKTSNEALTQSLKLPEVDLIHAIMKEKQAANENGDTESIVKKRFREIDFKFIVSPHITSFLKHFKNLGQVMLSEDSGNDARSSSRTSTPFNMLLPSPVAKRHNENGNSLRHSQNDDTQMSARERWARDRQMQAQRQNQGSNIFQFPASAAANEGGIQADERRARPMRALPRPETPEVYSRPVSQTPRREFIARPMSTPPVEMPIHVQSPKSRDVDRFSQSNQYHYVKAEPLSITERSSPVPIRGQHVNKNDFQNGRQEIQRGEPVRVFGQRPTTDQIQNEERPPSRSSTRSPGPTMRTTGFSLVNIKDEDVNFGRSFAAVQINDKRRQPVFISEDGDQESPQNSSRAGTPVNIRRTREQNNKNGPDMNSVGSPTPYRRQAIRSEPTRMDLNRSLSPAENQNTIATDEEKGRRWVHQTSFTSSGISSKRMISGIGALADGRIVLVDQEHYTVQLYDRNYRFVFEVKLESRPFDLAVLSDKKIVVSLQSERVLKFILVTGETLTSVADLGVPCEMVCYGICHGNGTYGVSCGDEVWLLSYEGRVINRIKNDKSGNPIFVQAEYITMDRTGNILFVSDAGNNNVLAIHIDGNRLWEFTYQGFKPCGLQYVEPYIYVCDKDQHRILMLNIDGQVVRQSIIGRLENPRAVCFSSAANTLFVTQMRHDAIVSPARPIHVFRLQ